MATAVATAVAFGVQWFAAVRGADVRTALPRKTLRPLEIFRTDSRRAARRSATCLVMSIGTVAPSGARRGTGVA